MKKIPTNISRIARMCLKNAQQYLKGLHRCPQSKEAS
jgi:hypothetical protein